MDRNRAVTDMIRRNVLIFHSGALGDFILSWPLVLACGRLFAQSRIICVCPRQKGLLAEKVLRVESTDSEIAWHGLFAEGGVVPEAQRKLLAGAHAIFSFIASPHDPWSENVRRIAPEARLTCLRPRPAHPGIHVADDLIDQLHPDRIVTEGVGQILRSIRERGLLSPWPAKSGILIHPGSGAREKCWPLDRFIEVIQHLSKTEPVRIVLGEVELDRWQRGERAQLEKVAPVKVCSTYLELLAEIQSSRTFVGNDSGPTHLAGILGAQTIAIFQSTHPAEWSPIGPRVTALKSPGVNDVVAAVKATS
jgi:heptosyltransferase III